MNGTITRADFDKGDIDEKLGIIFETLQSREQTCMLKITKLEKRKKFDTVIGGMGGIVGGFIAAWAWVKLK